MSHRVLRKDVECDEKVLENVLEKDVDWVRKCINFRWKVKVLKETINNMEGYKHDPGTQLLLTHDPGTLVANYLMLFICLFCSHKNASVMQ